MVGSNAPGQMFLPGEKTNLKLVLTKGCRWRRLWN